MKKAWEIKPLGEVAEVISGQSPKGANCNTRGKGTPFFQGKKEFGERYIGEPTTWTTQVTRLAKANDVLMSVRAPVGPVNLASQDLCIGRGLAAIRPNAAVTTDFLFYCLESKQAEIKGSEGAVFASINRKQIESIRIPIPPLPEQRRIVAVLDEAFQGIAAAAANAERNLGSTRDVLEAQRERLLAGGKHGWDEKSVGELCEIKHGFAFQSKYFTDDGDYVCLTPGNFFENGGYRERGDKTKYYSGPVPEGFVLSAGQMLVAMTEQAPGLLGSPAIVPEGEWFLHNQRLGLICPKAGIPWVNDFFFHVFNRQSFRKAVHRTATGVKVRHTSPSKLGQIAVSFPTSERDQRKAAAAINALQQETERLQEASRRKTAALDELKASLLHQAFTGYL